MRNENSKIHNISRAKDMAKTRNQIKMEKKEVKRKNISQAKTKNPATTHQLRSKPPTKISLGGDLFPDLEPARPLPPVPEKVELVCVDWKYDL